MNRILPGETTWIDQPIDRDAITWPKMERGAVMRNGQNTYIRDSPRLPNVICIGGFGPKPLRYINKRLRHIKHLSKNEHMAIIASGCFAFATLSIDSENRILQDGHILYGPGGYGISTASRSWPHPDLPGVAIVDTIRRVHDQPPARGPTVLFFPGKLDMMHIVASIGPAWMSATRAALKSFLPNELIGIIADYATTLGFDDWLMSYADLGRHT
jgi:hypothetical protein